MRKWIWGYRSCFIAAGTLLLAATFEARAAADDVKVCAKDSGDVAIEACSRAIKSGRYKGRELARLYLFRGVELRSKEDYDPAMADFGEAAKSDKKYADAFYNRCVILNLRKEYDAAIADCSQAIKLGPSPKATAATGGEALGKDRTISDYFGERGFAYLKKDDYAHAISDLDIALRQNPKNARALRSRGLAFEARGDTARAEADLAAAKQLGE
jgi:tetratricopeptide (TPR) repeat protein